MDRRSFSLRVAGMVAGGLTGCAVNNSGLATAVTDAESKFRSTLQQIETESGGRLGVAVLDTQTGSSRLWRGDERFPMCSTWKMVAAAYVLSRVDQGSEDLARRIVYQKTDLITYSPFTESRVGGGGVPLGELCEAAVTLSDNTAGNLLLSTFGGPEGLTAFFRRLGDRESRLDRWEPDLNSALPGDPRDTTTPSAMLATVQRIVLGDGLSSAGRQQITTWLLSNKVGDTKFRAGVPTGTRVADKTGGGSNGTNNDIGVIWLPGKAPQVLICYLTGARISIAEQNAVIAKITRLVTTG